MYGSGCLIFARSASAFSKIAASARGSCTFLRACCKKTCHSMKGIPKHTDCAQTRPGSALPALSKDPVLLSSRGHSSGNAYREISHIICARTRTRCWTWLLVDYVIRAFKILVTVVGSDGPSSFDVVSVQSERPKIWSNQPQVCRPYAPFEASNRPSCQATGGSGQKIQSPGLESATHCH